jgi:hypothetical protein
MPGRGSLPSYDFIKFVKKLAAGEICGQRFKKINIPVWLIIA